MYSIHSPYKCCRVTVGVGSHPSDRRDSRLREPISQDSATFPSSEENRALGVTYLGKESVPSLDRGCLGRSREVYLHVT